ncbi:MAG: hypothetical protein QME49_02595 [bacterium]|nr:hypothetical protein [bacterium]
MIVFAVLLILLFPQALPAEGLKPGDIVILYKARATDVIHLGFYVGPHYSKAGKYLGDMVDTTPKRKQVACYSNYQSKWKNTARYISQKSDRTLLENYPFFKGLSSGARERIRAEMVRYADGEVKRGRGFDLFENNCVDFYLDALEYALKKNNLLMPDGLKFPYPHLPEQIERVSMPIK